MTTASEFSPQNFDSDESNNQEPVIPTDGEILVAAWKCREFHDQELFSGEETLTTFQMRYVLFQRLFDVMHGGFGFHQRLTWFPTPIIPDLFWTGGAVAKFAPEVEVFLDLADMLVSCDDGTGECDFRQTKQMLA